MAGKIYYLPPIDYASGRVYGTKYGFTSVYRKSNKYPKGCMATGERDTTNHPYSETELNIHQKFRAVVISTRQRLKDPTKVSQDQAAFKSQSVFRTVYQYVFNQEWNDYQG